MRKEIPSFENYNDRWLPELEWMILALYREDSYGEKMTRRKIVRTVRELSSHSSKGSIILFRFGPDAAGYAIVVFHWSNEYGGDIAFIDELYVKPKFRNRGIGSAFIEYMLTLKAENLRGLQVEVTPVNRRAAGFYARHGFSPLKNRCLFRMIRIQSTGSRR